MAKEKVFHMYTLNRHGLWNKNFKNALHREQMFLKSELAKASHAFHGAGFLRMPTKPDSLSWPGSPAGLPVHSGVTWSSGLLFPMQLVQKRTWNQGSWLDRCLYPGPSLPDLFFLRVILIDFWDFLLSKSVLDSGDMYNILFLASWTKNTVRRKYRWFS